MKTVQYSNSRIASEKSKIFCDFINQILQKNFGISSEYHEEKTPFFSRALAIDCRNKGIIMGEVRILLQDKLKYQFGNNSSYGEITGKFWEKFIEAEKKHEQYERNAGKRSSPCALQ